MGPCRWGGSGQPPVEESAFPTTFPVRQLQPGQQLTLCPLTHLPTGARPGPELASEAEEVKDKVCQLNQEVGCGNSILQL